jgi:hypothetical protein
LLERLAICRLSSDDKIPALITEGNYWFILRSSNELSIVCQREFLPEDVKCEAGWRVFGITGTISCGLPGILTSFKCYTYYLIKCIVQFPRPFRNNLILDVISSTFII